MRGWRGETGTWANSSRTAELRRLPEGKMSAWETEQDGQRPREGWAQGRRVEAGGWDSPASAKKRTCPKSSSAFSRIMKFHGSATFTLS